MLRNAIACICLVLLNERAKNVAAAALQILKLLNSVMFKKINKIDVLLVELHKGKV